MVRRKAHKFLRGFNIERRGATSKAHPSLEALRDFLAAPRPLRALCSKFVSMGDHDDRSFDVRGHAGATNTKAPLALT